jgi:regulator of extracellular matrix RemA (YlzA/DUF370 family)
MINAGFQNYINTKRILSVVDFSTDKPAPVKRAIKVARGMGTLIDITQGRPTNSVIFMENGYIILSNISGPTIIKRIKEAKKNA